MLEIEINEIKNGWLLRVEQFTNFDRPIGPLYFKTIQETFNYLKENVLSEGQLIDDTKEMKKK